MTKKLKFVKELELDLDALMQPIALLGNRGGGKTYAGQALFEVAHDNDVQCVAIDGIGKWWALRLGKDGHAKGLGNVFIFGGKRGDFPLTPDKGAFVARVLVEKRVSAVLDVSLMRKGDRRRFVTDFAEEFYLLKKQQDVADPCVIFLEEAHQFIPQKPQPDEARMLGAFEDIVSEGRNAGLGVVVMDQRPARANKNVLALVELLVVLRTTYKSDRDVYADWIVQRAAEGAAEVDLHKTLPFLKAGHGYLYAPLFDQFGRVTVLPKRTFDASATAKVGVAVKSIGTLTPVDVEKLTEAMAVVVADAEQKNPEALKRRVRQLEAELEAKPTAAPPPKPSAPKGPSPAEVQLAKTLAETLTRAEKLSEKTAKLAGQVTAAAGILGDSVAELGEMARTVDQAAHTLKRQPAPPPRESKLFEPRPVLAVKPKPPPRLADGEPPKFGRCERALLAAFGLRHPRPVSRDQVSILSGYSSTSSSFANGIGALRSAGLIDGTGDALRLTAAGEAEAHESIGSAPQHLDQTRAMWRGKLGKAELALFDVLCDAYPNALTKEELSERSGYSATSSSFANALGRLRTLALAGNVAGGVAVANDLFSEAA